MSSRSAIILVLVAANMLGLAATDLYLPSLPHLPGLLGTTVEGAQLTLVFFSAGFAVSQIFIGAMGDLYNRRWILLGSLAVFVPASAFCAMAGDIAALNAARFLQGLSASASAALTAPMIRQYFEEHRAVHAMSVIGGIDAVIPAFAPILGGWVFTQFGWEMNFWIVAFAGGLVLLAGLKALPDDTPESHETSLWSVMRGYGFLFRHRIFLAYSISHGLVLGGLLAVVFSAPQLLSAHMGGGTAEFVYCQMIWVGLFLAAAQGTGYLSARMGADRLILLGSGFQAAGALAALTYAFLASQPHWLGFALSCAPYMMGMGLRGGACFAQALAAVPAHGARASSLILFFSMGFIALGTGLAAPFLEGGIGVAGAALGAGVLLSLAALLPLRARAA